MLSWLVKHAFQQLRHTNQKFKQNFALMKCKTANSTAVGL